MNTTDEAVQLLEAAWPRIQQECCCVLGGELHYQAMVYHALRLAGVPIRQIGMNVKQWIENPTSTLFKALNERRHVDYRGGFEPIPDVVLFRPEINGDWRRRNRDNTLKHMLLAIEVKASERDKGRLTKSEILRDIDKLAAQREEVLRLGGDFILVMMVIDVAPLVRERMYEDHITICMSRCAELDVAWRYTSRE